VSPKTLALVAAAALVMGMGLYLFVQVRSSPAQAHSPTPAAPALTTTARPSPVQGRSTEPLDVEAIAPPGRPPTSEHGGDAQLTAAARAINDRVAAEAPALDEQRANPRADAMMDLANKHYDAQDFDQAIAVAQKVLANDPANVRMLRVMVSANCIGGDSAIAQQYYEKLPVFDRGQMKSRCERYGVFFTDPAQ
jgi:hypothetical protein